VGNSSGLRAKKQEPVSLKKWGKDVFDMIFAVDKRGQDKRGNRPEGSCGTVKQVGGLSAKEQLGRVKKVM